MPALSILIPARNEMFLKQTVDDILKNIEGDTEVIVVLDGAWPEVPLMVHPRLTVIYNNTSVGQRAATNQAARISTAKYLMKVDAHCAFDKGFDVKMMNEMQDDWTMVPTMYNLHVFNWKCTKCKWKKYQGGDPKECPECHSPTERELVWKPKKSPESQFYRFDRSLHFQYWSGYKRRPEAKGDIADTLSIQGSCFMITRDKYFELDICSEDFNSWGQQGVEVAMKTWMSGGRLVVNKKTWYAHMFRTQPGFKFPYENPESKIQENRKLSRELFQNNQWKGTKVKFEDVLKKFYPVPDWDEPDFSKQPKPTKAVVYYTDNTLDPEIMEACQRQLKKGIKEKHITTVSLGECNFGQTRINMNLARGYLTMARQILTGLLVTDADVVFFCEHDVLYHPSHFDFIPMERDKVYYNTNVWRVRLDDGHALWTDDLKQLSGICAYRDVLIKHYQKRVQKLEKKIRELGDGKEFLSYVRKMGFEPGTHGRNERVDDLKSEIRMSESPNIDIRHTTNTTPSRWDKSQFRDKRYTRGWTEQDTVTPWNWEKGKFKDFIKKI